MSLKRKPDLMDYRILTILEITLESNELLSSEDVAHTLQVEYRIMIQIEEVTKILEQLADANYLVRYSPSGFLSIRDTTYYLGPKLANQERVKI